MTEDALYQESCESLRYCEDFIGQPRDFPKKQTVSLPKPQVRQYPYEETWQHYVEEERAHNEGRVYKCCNCIYDNGSVVCRKKEAEGKKAPSSLLKYDPNNWCNAWKPNWDVLFPNRRK